MNDLEICKRIAEIEGTPPEFVGEYNPLTDDALCFQLMIKYKVEVDFTCKEACIYYCTENVTFSCGVSFSCGISINKAICLAIIEVNK